MNRYTTRPDLLKMMQKYHEGTATEAEKAFVDQYYAFFDQKYKDEIQVDTEDRESMQQEMEAWLLDYINTPKEELLKKPAIKLWPRIIGIAAAVAAITLGVWLYHTSTDRHSDPALSSRVSRDLYANDIAPGGNKATIKIGDGEAITLSDKQTGVIVGNDLKYNDNTFVIQSGPLSSRANGLSSRTNGLSSRANAKDLTTTITTPRGGTYQITLPDGTKVWLNAASVLTYTMPLKERGGVREVKLSGEAYFEVFRNKNQAFVVTTKKLTTTVLGTHFNISAYEDENNTKATLLEGSVRVTTLSSRANAKDLDSSYPRNDKGVSNDVGIKNVVTLTPNHQAILTASNQITVKEVDAEAIIAWKDGTFRFQKEPLESIMSKLSRWYNIEVVYESEQAKAEPFGGIISRNSNISAVLRMLERTGQVKFKIEGKKVWVIR